MPQGRGQEIPPTAKAKLERDWDRQVRQPQGPYQSRSLMCLEVTLRCWILLSHKPNREPAASVPTREV